MGKRRRKICCDIFDDTSLPPCAEFLGNINPIIKDGEIIYRNNNRLYFFLSFDISTNKNSNIEYDPADPSTFMSNSIGHIQISSYNFFIGIFSSLKILIFFSIYEFFIIFYNFIKATHGKTPF